jgi:MFS transporter, DHA1 family, multidrug resistance protein
MASPSPTDTNSPAYSGPGRIEFVILISAVMMITAFAIDSMLTALPAIGDSLHITQENDRQYVISSFLGGFSAAQLFIGTITDRYGRRKLMLYALVGFAITSLGATLAQSFDQLLVARVLQGMMGATAQVVVRSVVRDRFSGREMAQVMSLASMIFMAAPILAPAMGQLVLNFGPWRWIFAALALIGLIVWFWVLLRMPETLRPENRTPIEMASIVASARTVVTDRMSMGYSAAMAAISVGLFGYLLSVQQIFEHTLKRPELLPTGFALMAGGMAAASLLNATIVKRYGMRLIGHAALLFFIAVAGIHMLVALSGYETLFIFITLQTLMMIGFSLIAGNFGAMAMENMGGVAGMANSLQGSMANVAGIIFGTVIGQAFDGTTIPLYIGFFVCGLFALVAVLITERGHLFVARNAPPTGD